MAYTGINRGAIEGPARAIIRKVTGLPEDRVFWARDQANVAAPNRPFISMFIRTPTDEHRRGQVDYGGLLEYWRIQVDGDDDGLYRATVSDVDHDFVASGNDQGQIRDGLVAALASSLTANVSAAGQISVDIESNTPKARLQVEVSSPNGNLSLAKLRGNVAEVTRQDVEPELELFCWGLFSDNDPSFEDYGETTAERLGSAFLSPTQNAEMVRAGHPPLTSRYREQDRILNGEAETIGIVTIRLGTIACHVTDLQDTTAASMNCHLA